MVDGVHGAHGPHVQRLLVSKRRDKGLVTILQLLPLEEHVQAKTKKRELVVRYSMIIFNDICPEMLLINDYSGW